MKKIGIILLNYNGLKDTLECLESLKTINRDNYEHQIFVVDYSKNDQEAETIKSKFPKIKLIKKQENLGFAGGNNEGINAAQTWGAEYILLLNNDTLVSSYFLAQLFRFLEDHQEVGCVSPKIYFAKGREFHYKRYQTLERGKVIWYAGGLIDWDNVYGSHQGVDQVDNGQFDEPSETEFVSGCCVLIRRKVLDQCGGLEEKLFMYWEDSDFSMRVKKAGWKIMYDPKAFIWHKNAGGSGVGSDLHDYFLQRNRLWFGMKYGAVRTKFALLRQSLVQLATGSPWTKRGIADYYLGRMGKGSWK